MKRILLSAIALVAFGAAAHAADLPRKAPPMRAVAPTATWTGFYIGGHVGGAWRYDDTVFGATTSGRDARFMGGGQIGFDYQFWNQWVIGFEAHYSALARNNDGAAFAGGFVLYDRTRGLFSATGRLGYAWGPALLYFKGGYAYRDQSTGFFGPAAWSWPPPGHNSRDGYTLGVGVEYMFMPNWSAKLEYQYYGFDRTTFLTPPSLVATNGVREDEHTIKLGINYRFNAFRMYGR